MHLGIGGSRLLRDGTGSKRPEAGVPAFAGFDRDVLAQPGVKYLMILDRINDIGHPGSAASIDETVTAHDLVADYLQ